jgi:hypothetical protein
VVKPLGEGIALRPPEADRPEVEILRRRPSLSSEDHRLLRDSRKLPDVSKPNGAFKDCQRFSRHSLGRKTVPRVGLDADVHHRRMRP